jgi:hypothetical protein
MGLSYKRPQDEEAINKFLEKFSQVVAGVESLEVRCKLIQQISQSNEYHFFEVREQIKEARRERIDIVPESVAAVMSNLERYLKELEYADQCLESAMKHLDCFEATNGE